MRFFLSIIIFLLVSIGVYGQSDSETPTVIPNGDILLRNHFRISTQSNGGVNTLTSFFIPSIRYGLGNRFELRFNPRVQLSRMKGGDFRKVNSGLGPFGMGTKIALVREDGWIPDIGVFGFLTFPTGLPAFNNSKINSEFRLSMGHSLGNRAGVTVNYGGTWDGISQGPEYLYTLLFNYNFSPLFGAYIETFGTFSKEEEPSHQLHLGASYAVAHNARFGIGWRKNFSSGLPNNLIDAVLFITIPR
ncbi:transporter [Xanthovirga aplysinae]|uniref:transporter n=1 Tax=Xanthovirga aplysinae TaxID=2529853 RepID=UPI0012BC3C4B|nr:transporter [Xanthovirga aplysinae]MTI30951.1 hypothetical protein [Xanthovirga aplysinae]